MSALTTLKRPLGGRACGYFTRALHAHNAAGAGKPSPAVPGAAAAAMVGIAVAAPCPATSEAAFGPEAVLAWKHRRDAARLLRIIAGTMRACPTPPQSPLAAAAAAAGASKSSARG